MDDKQCVEIREQWAPVERPPGPAHEWAVLSSYERWGFGRVCTVIVWGRFE